MKKIRLGFVRCDTHSYYFGAMAENCDPLLLQKNNYVVHHYFSDIYSAEKLNMPRISGFEITRAYDYDSENAKRFSETFLHKPVVCESLDEMTQGIDAVFVADCDGGGGDHLKLATPFLKKGISIFVDKPFASTFKDAQEIVRLAKKHHALLFNSSILSQVPAADKFKRRFDEIITQPSWPIPAAKPPARIGLGIIKGVGGAFSQELEGKKITGGLENRLAYIIHGIALALNLFGKGVEWVEAMGNLPLEYLHLHLKSGIEVIILNTSTDIFPESCYFYASAYSKYGAIYSQPIGDPEFIAGAAKILRMFKKMIQTGKPPTPYENILENIAIVDAAQLAQKKGARVYLKEILKRNER